MLLPWLELLKLLNCEIGHSCVVPKLRKKGFNFSLCSMMHAAGLLRSIVVVVNILWVLTAFCLEILICSDIKAKFLRYLLHLSFIIFLSFVLNLCMYVINLPWFLKFCILKECCLKTYSLSLDNLLFLHSFWLIHVIISLFCFFSFIVSFPKIIQCYWIILVYDFSIFVPEHFPIELCFNKAFRFNLYIVKFTRLNCTTQ